MRASNLDELHEQYTIDEILTAARMELGLPVEAPSFTLFAVARKQYYQCSDLTHVCNDYGLFCEEGRVPLVVGSWALRSTFEPAT